MPELRLDPLDQDAAEEVGPGVVRRGADAGRRGRAGERVAVGRAVGVEGRQQVDAGVSAKASATRQPLRLGERIGLAAAEGEASSRPAASAASAQERGAVVHQRARRARRPDTIRAW